VAGYRDAYFSEWQDETVAAEIRPDALCPMVTQRFGVEWLFRLVQEPRRLFSRYARTNGRFTLLLARA